MSIRFRDYQQRVIVDVFTAFGIEPAGPPDDEIVIAFGRGNGTGKDCTHGRDSETLAGRSGDDDKPPIRTEYSSDPDF